MHGVEKSRAGAREARKMHFCTQGEFSCIRTINLNLMIQKGSRVIQMIIAHKSFFYIFYIFKRRDQKNKVALSVELSISWFEAGTTIQS